MTVSEMGAMSLDFEVSNKRPDETESQWRFEHPGLSDLPSLCQKSLLVHGHREGLVRFKKLLFACNGMKWALLNPASEVNVIVQKALDNLRQPGVTSSYVKAVAELMDKHEWLLSDKNAPSTDDVQAHAEYLRLQYAKLVEIFAEESKAAVLYAEFMLPRQIKD